MSGRKYTRVEPVTPSYFEQAMQDLQNRLNARIQQLKTAIEKERAKRVEQKTIVERQKQYEQSLSNIVNESLQEAEIRHAAQIADISQKAERRNYELRQELERTTKTLQEQLQAADQNRRELEHAMQAERSQNQKQFKELQLHIQELREEGIELQKGIAENKQKILDLRDEVNQEFSTLYQNLENEAIIRQEADARIQAQIDQIKEDKERSRFVAKVWIEDGAHIADFIRKNYQHERFMPGELERLQRQLDQAQEFLNNDIPDAALANAAQTTHNLSALRRRLEVLESEWLHYKDTATLQIEALREAIKDQQNVFLDQDHNHPIDTDHWSQGELSKLDQRLEAIYAKLTPQDCEYTTQELKELTESLKNDETVLSEIIDAAISNIVRAQNRAEILETCIESLLNAGYTLKGWVYEGDDNRVGMVALVNNQLGDTIAVTVRDDGNGSVVIIEQDTNRPVAPREREENANNIVDGLNRTGIKAEIPRTIQEAPSKENTNLEEVINRNVKPVPVVIPSVKDQAKHRAQI